ncbi:helix-turn-helix transcriptional regulator [Staphylococcus haemolyticus]|uniref:helix-turn-helix transcriptional regulator n=1 Tax=Staphylococcus haemolyticus TaxID=1283 RepID=UPI00187A0F71|nr:helix-turn-helix transcriptional regulator [Staphylococcus haemolyticus]MBE7354931.1 helix-turn-helix transcriptional regulator [Staphylococcus haemolyticus]
MYNMLKAMREEKGITITELSKKTGLSRNTIYLLESNKTTPNLETIIKLSSGLNEKPEKIFNQSVIRVLQKEA